MSKISIVLDSTQITEYKWCKRAWWYRYREHLEKPGSNKIHLDYGSLIHALLETYYNLRGMNPKESADVHAKAAIDMLNSQKIWEGFKISQEEWKWLQMRYIQYMLYYRAHGDFHPIVNKNGTPAVELGFSKVLYEDAFRVYVVEGRIDLIAKMATDPRVFFTDHKTQGTKKDLYPLKPQFLTYAWATGLRWGLINYIGTTKEPTRDTFRRQLIEFTPYMIELWENQLKEIYDDIYANMKIKEDRGDALTAPIEYDDNIFGRDLTSCAGAFESNPCQFTNICTTQDINMKLNIKKFNFAPVKPWKPWE